MELLSITHKGLLCLGGGEKQCWACACGMAQWSSSAGSLGRWAGPWRCGAGSPLPPCRRAPAPVKRRSGRVRCATVPRELGAAAEAARPVVDDEVNEEEGIVCDGCGGAGWRLCDFCQGKKNNVKSEGTRVYRRCPTCKAAGFILCPSCRVYKCITFPESNEA